MARITVYLHAKEEKHFPWFCGVKEKTDVSTKFQFVAKLQLF
jgi:hypothetical protein